MIGFFVPKKPINCKIVDLRFFIAELLQLNFSTFSLFFVFKITVFENNLETVPYLCFFSFLQPKKKTMFKTKTYIKSLEPVWDTEMTFEGVTLDDLRDRVLEISIYDEEHDKKGRLVGFLRLGPGGNLEKWDDCSYEEKDLWYSMLNNPNQWNMKLVPIRIEP